MNRTYLDNALIDSLDFKSIAFLDLSTYNEDLVTSNPILAVTPPNFNCPVEVTYATGTSTVINSTVLGWTATNNFMTLADGLWTFTQSVCPNDKIYKTKKHLRILLTKSKILQELMEARESCNNCEDYSKWWKLLQDLEIAKYMVENCEEEKGVLLFNAINSQLFKCATC